MSARSVSMGAMFGWVSDTFGLVKRHFGAMSVASLLTICAGVLFALPIMLVMFKTVPMTGAVDPTNPVAMDMGLFLTVYVGVIVVALVLVPPLLAGWFRLIESADRGAEARGTSIFQPYGDFPTWRRLVGFMLLAMLMYFAVFAVVALAFGGVFTDLVAMQAAQNAALLSGQTPPTPDMSVIGRILLMYVFVLPVMLLLQFVYMLGLAEVSLRPTPVLVAFKDAFAGVLRNSLKLLLFMFVLGMVVGVVFSIIVLVLVLVVAALGMISKSLAAVAIVLMYIPILLVMYPLMFAGHYMVWKSMLGSEPRAPLVPADSVAA